MSRMIDADALKDYILRSVPNWSEDRETALDCIANSPTIEERKKGKWICLDKGNAFFVPHMLQCSECGNTLDKHGVNAGRGDANYCPNCGSYNGGRDDEVD